MDGIAVLVIVGLLAIAGVFAWFILAAIKDQENRYETVRRMRQEVLDQVLRDSKKGEVRDWSFDDTVVTRVGDRDGAPKGFQATNLKISENEGFARLTQCYFCHVDRTSGYSYEADESIVAEIKAQDILGIEISANEEHTQFQSGKIEGKAGSALIGTALFGVAGGIIGSSGKRDFSSTSHTVRSITALALERSTKDKSLPWLFIYFYSAHHTFITAFDGSQLGMRVEDVRSLVEFKQMREWYSQLQGLVSDENRLKTAEAANLSGQLEKLSRLHADGRLSDEEYHIAKRKIIEA